LGIVDAHGGFARSLASQPPQTCYQDLWKSQSLSLLLLLLLTAPSVLWHEQVPADRTELVPVSIDRGFEIHHAEKSYIMLNM